MSNPQARCATKTFAALALAILASPGAASDESCGAFTGDCSEAMRFPARKEFFFGGHTDLD